jgi:mRNA interferase MazF
MTGQDIRRGEVWWVSLDPTQGSEIQKTRPCVVLTHDTLNRLRRTVVVIPLSSSAQPHPPITIPVSCEGKNAVAVIDQVRAVAKHRLRSKVEDMAPHHLNAIAAALGTILELKS